jgi:hypothetical protein
MEILSTETLHLFRDGMLAEMLDAEIKKVYKDCLERPALKKTRTVTLNLKFTPPGDTVLDACGIEAETKSSIPAQGFVRQVKAHRAHQGFGFDVDTDSVSHHPDQMTFPQDED